MKQSAREVARVDSERRASSETKSELSRWSDQTSRLSRWSDQTVGKKRVIKSHRIYVSKIV